MARDPNPTARQLNQRLARCDWRSVEADLNDRGWARLTDLLSEDECRALRGLYGQRKRFRSFVDLDQHRYGANGDYRYFAAPLPPLVRALRTALYARLAPIANRWQAVLGIEERFPPRLTPFLRHCRERGQTRPTPLLLHYEADGYNCLHQDRYGEVAFPLQVVCLLSRPGGDFEGGEFLLTEQRPRMQSRGEAIRMEMGDAVVFPGLERPVQGSRGAYRATLRHGVSRVHAGERFTLGLIFHDAR
jgi:hypothetical protein